MVDPLWFIGLPCKDDGDEPTPADRQRLAEVLAGQGFRTAPADFGSSLEVWLPDLPEFLASVDLGSGWVVHIHIDEYRLAEHFDENRGNTDALAKLIGVATEFASTYLGFVTVGDDDDDFSFMDEYPLGPITQPLAMVYLGRRYLSDWPEEPGWAADPQARWELPAGVLLVPASSPLEITRA